MNKYKVEFMRTESFVVDVVAKNEAEAKTKASLEFKKIVSDGMEHYYQTEETETEVTLVYDVTATDDPFSPINK